MQDDALDVTKNEDYQEPTDDHETDSDGASDGEAEQAPEAPPTEDDDGGDDDGNDFRDRLNRAHNQIERLKKENARLKGEGGGRKEGGETVAGSPEHIEKALLAAYGYKDKDDQLLIKEMARKSGLTVVDALEDDFIMARLEHVKKKDEVRRAAARPSGKGTTSKRDASYYIDRGVMPKDPEEARKVRAELARRSAEQFS